MRTLRLFIVGTMMSMLLGGPGGAVAAQDIEQVDIEPAGPLEPGGASIFTMRQIGVEDVPWPGSIPGPDGSLRWEGPTDVWVIESSDPRLSGTYTLFGKGEAWPLDEEGRVLATVMSGALQVENEEGAWSGTRVSYMGVDYADYYHLEGEGVYEGLTALFHAVAVEARGDEAFMTYSGVVVPGSLPDYPSLPAE